MNIEMFLVAIDDENKNEVNPQTVRQIRQISRIREWRKMGRLGPFENRVNSTAMKQRP